MDKLEKFIREKRQDLDLYEPDQSIWSNIRLRQGRTKMILREYFLKAAMVIIVVASSFIIYNITSNNSVSEFDRTTSLDNDLSPDFIETEIYYNTRVNTLLKEAKPMLVSDPALEQNLMSDISRLDSLCADIRRDLKDNISNQEVIEALVMNHRIKVHILEDMLSLLRDQEMNNNDNRKKNEL